MDRRKFIKLILSSAVAHKLDIDKLLWVPGAKKIFLPPIKIVKEPINFNQLSWSTQSITNLSELRFQMQSCDLFYSQEWEIK